MALFRPYQQSTPEQRAEKKAAAEQLAAEQAERRERLAAEQQAVKEQQAAEQATTEVAPEPAAKPAKRKAIKAAQATVAEAPVVAEPVAAAATNEDGTPLRRGYTPKKGRPTPTRVEAEQARQNRVNPKLTPKEQRKLDRAARSARNAENFAKAEEEPTRVLLRDYIDSRWSITEFIFPVVILLFAASMAFAKYPLITQVLALVMMVIFISWIVNVWWMWRGFKIEAVQRLKNPKFRGLLMYGNARMMSIRRFRRPPPRIKRGEDY